MQGKLGGGGAMDVVVCGLCRSVLMQDMVTKPVNIGDGVDEEDGLDWTVALYWAGCGPADTVISLGWPMALFTWKSIPTPDKATWFWFPCALSTMVKVALSLPTTDGVKVTLIVQYAAGFKVAGSVPQVLVCVKSAAFAPLIAIAETSSGALPVLVRVGI